MNQYLIEIPHEAEHHACAKAVKHFLELGSHLMTHTDWGCEDGVHKAWLKVEAASKTEAGLTLPPMLRARAVVTALNKFSPDDVEAFLRPAPALVAV